LRENSYAVDVAETGEKGLEQATDVTYDAILLDVRLPGMSGLEVCVSCGSKVSKLRS